MAYLLPDVVDEPNDYSANYWMLSTGPFGVSGFCLDGVEIGDNCYICRSDIFASSHARSHFDCKKHTQKVKGLRSSKKKFIVEPSTGGDMDDPDNLFLPDRCKVCDAELSTVEQQEVHYLSEKHQKKVRNYFLVKIGIRTKKSGLTLDEEELKNKSMVEYCTLCKVELSAPVVAQAHYAGKKHAKKLREKIESSGDSQWLHCDICEIQLQSESQMMQHLQSQKHQTNIENFGSEALKQTRESVSKRKEEIEIMLKEEDAKRACLTQELEEIKKLEQLHS